MRIQLASSAFIWLICCTAQADIINVPGDFGTIQAAISDPGTVDGDEIVVAQGEYFENINFFGKAITVRSTDPNDAGVVLNTIINGGGSGTVVTCDGGEGSGTVLSGFVITGGNTVDGGGMFNDGSSPTVTNCSFSGNTATRHGSGMYNFFNTSIATVTNCSFIGNSATDGGGMVNGQSNATVTNCTFSGNTASNSGGGMSIALSLPSVTNCTFSGNTASGNGGGGIFSFPGGPSLTNTGFCGNTPDHINSGFADGGGNCFWDNCVDINIDGVVNVLDLIDLLLCFGQPAFPSCEAEDINFDGTVNVLDLIDLLLAFGTVCPSLLGFDGG